MKQVRLFLAVSIVAGALVLGSRAVPLGATQGGTVQAPRFEVDPMWPKPLPNNWLLGSATGLAVDSRDHVYVIHLTDSFTFRTETGADSITPAGGCCSSAPNVLEFDPAGNLVNSWGGPGQGYDWPARNAGIAIDPAGSSWRSTGKPASCLLRPRQRRRTRSTPVFPQAEARRRGDAVVAVVAAVEERRRPCPQRAPIPRCSAAPPPLLSMLDRMRSTLQTGPVIGGSRWST